MIEIVQLFQQHLTSVHIFAVAFFHFSLLVVFTISELYLSIDDTGYSSFCKSALDVTIHAILAAETLFQKCSISSSLKASYITNFGLALLSFSFLLPRIVWFGVWGVILGGLSVKLSGFFAIAAVVLICYHSGF